MRFIDKGGAARYGRYRLEPAAGIEHLDDKTSAGLGPNFLFQELTERVKRAPIGFRVLLQVAADGDVVDDATANWPASRQVVELGEISLTSTVPEDHEEQRHIIFDPIPRVDGIEASADPLLELRAAVYLISGRRRRAAETAKTSTA
jgi:catalase